MSSNPTPILEPVTKSSSSPIITSFEESDLIWEEFEAYLASDSFLPGNDDPVDLLLEEFADELALITFPSGNDDLPFDIESDLSEIEYLLNHDPTKEMDFILEDSVDEGNLANPNNDLVDNIPEMFTDEHTLDYSSPPLYDDVDDDLVELEYGNDDVDALPLTNNEDKVFNPGILIHENLFEITIRVTPDKNVKKLSSSNASLILEDFNPPLYELPFHKEVLGFETLLSFSSKNEEKVFNPGILTSKGVRTSLLPELSHRDSKAFKVIKIFESPMEIFPCSYGENICILDVPNGYQPAALRTQITNDIRNGAESSGGSGGDATPQGIHVWIERFTKLKPLAFRSAVTPAEAEDWITHMEKLFQVLGCPDNFKTRLAAFKLEGDALSWWKAHLRTQHERCSEAELDISRWVKEVGFRRIRYYGVRRKVAQGCAAARNMKLFVHEMGNSISVIEMRNRFIMGTGANRNKGRHDQGNFRVPGPEVNGSAGPERRSTETLPPSTSLYYLIVPSKTEAEYANRFLLTASLLQDEFYATTLISAKTSGRIRLQFAFLFKCLDFDVDYRAWMVASHRATMVFLASVMDTSVGEEIEYGIKSNSQSEPISKAPYRMAPVELKELKESVTEMLENGLLDPVFHRGVTASSFLGRIVSQQHHMDSTKVKAITKRPRPDLVTEDSFRGIETGIVVCSILTLPSGSVVFPDLQPMILSVAAVVFALKIWRHILPSGKANVDLQMPLSRKSVLTSSKQIKEAQKGRWRVVAIVSECEDGKHTSSGVDDGGVVCLKIGDVFPNDQTLARSYDGQPHSSPFTIHPGSTKMYRDLKQYFWWNGMKQDVAIRWRFLCGNGNEIPWNFVTGLAYYQKDMMRLGGCLIGLTSLLISYPFEETKVVGPELIEITNEKVAVAKEKLKEARSRQKSYADKHRRNLEFQVGDRIQPDNVLCPSSLNPSGSSERSHDKHTIIPFCEDSLKNHPEREATWETGRIYAS
ncbi:reverse transcriptase domain-containing protein [Tanacetum coccineum]